MDIAQVVYETGSSLGIPMQWVLGACVIVTLASFVCALTPTPKDDAVLANVYKVIEMLAMNVGRAKEHGSVVVKGPILTRQVGVVDANGEVHDKQQ